MRNNVIKFSLIFISILISFSSAQGAVRRISEAKADFEYKWVVANDAKPDWFVDESVDGDSLGDDFFARLPNERNNKYNKLVYMYAVFGAVNSLPDVGAGIAVPDDQGTVIDGGSGQEDIDVYKGGKVNVTVFEQSWLLSQCPAFETIQFGSLIRSFRQKNNGDAPALLSLTIRTRCLTPDSGSTVAFVGFAFFGLVLLRCKLK